MAASNAQMIILQMEQQTRDIPADAAVEPTEDGCELEDLELPQSSQHRRSQTSSS